jgi:hypothetical protein
MKIELAGNMFFLWDLDAGNTNPAPKHLENPLVDGEPLEIEFSGEAFFWGISMRRTRIRCPTYIENPLIEQEPVDFGLVGKFLPILGIKNK